MLENYKYENVNLKNQLEFVNKQLKEKKNKENQA